MSDMCGIEHLGRCGISDQDVYQAGRSRPEENGG
jgi:hypothetical protein